MQDSHRESYSSLNAGNDVNAQVRVLGRRHSSHRATTSLDEIIPESEDWYIAGGSSGGSAVAVAAGVAFAYVWISLTQQIIYLLDITFESELI